ncbi:MAG: hypothetical protein ACYTGZ_05435 [Planctomycetota bacterium]|jgi:hypothetical protein
MKWLAFTAVVVVALIALGVWSVVPPNVVWEGRDPHCPRCRSSIKFYSRLCADCDRSLDWSSQDEECFWCLSKEDVEYLKDSYRELDLDEKGHQAVMGGFSKAYFVVMEPGACSYCAGLGKVSEGEAEVTCAVCRGQKQCVGCDGDREAVLGEEDAHNAWKERADAWERARARSELTGLPVRKSRLVDQDVEVLSGYVEAEEIVDERGSPLLKRAQARAALAFQTLEEAQRAKVKISTKSGDSG